MVSATPRSASVACPASRATSHSPAARSMAAHGLLGGPGISRVVVSVRTASAPVVPASGPRGRP
eukprot:10218230-Heterocapsa_arctica.AAC.1